MYLYWTDSQRSFPINNVQNIKGLKMCRKTVLLFAALFAMLEDGIISYYNASMLLKMKEMITQIAVLRRPPPEMSEASFFFIVTSNVKCYFDIFHLIGQVKVWLTFLGFRFNVCFNLFNAWGTCNRYNACSPIFLGLPILSHWSPTIPVR